MATYNTRSMMPAGIESGQERSSGLESKEMVPAQHILPK